MRKYLSKFSSLLIAFSLLPSILQAYPDGPLKLVVPFAPGGGSDTIARIIQKAIRDEKLSPVPLVIVNVPGAGGTIGSRQVRDAKADGQTLLLLHDGIFTAKYSGKVSFGAEAFEPVVAMGRGGMVLAVKSDSRFSDLSSLLGEAASNPDSITYSTNLGAPSHFAGLMLEQAQFGASFRFVQGGGGAKRLSALLGDHAEVSVFSIAEYDQFKASGLRALAVLSKTRHPEFPDLPCSYEVGISVESANTQFAWAPKGTSAERIQWLSDLFRKVSESAFYKDRMAAMHIDNKFWAGQKLSLEIETLDAAYSSVDLRKMEHSPQLERWILGGVLFLGLGFLPQARRSNKSEKNTYRTKRAFFGAFLTALYVALLQLGTDYRLATLLFLFAFGAIFLRPSPVHLVRLGLFALVCALLMHWVFTGPLFVDLP